MFVIPDGMVSIDTRVAGPLPSPLKGSTISPVTVPVIQPGGVVASVVNEKSKIWLPAWVRPAVAASNTTASIPNFIVRFIAQPLSRLGSRTLREPGGRRPEGHPSAITDPLPIPSGHTRPKGQLRGVYSPAGAQFKPKMRFFYENGPQKETVARQPGPIRNGSSGVPGSWCWVVRGKLLFSNDLWRKAGHSVYRTQVTEIKRLTMNLREQPPGTPEEPTVQPVKLRVSPRKWSRDPRPGLVGSLISAVQRHRGRPGPSGPRRSRLASWRR